MKKYGKYEKRPEGVPAPAPKQSKKMKNALLQTYITSLLCMVLCVTMFFGTSFAWFTSEVNNSGNQIYIGTLDVGLFNKIGVDEQTQEVKWDDLSIGDEKLFDGEIRWEPGYTALETIKVTNQGDLAFKYVLNFIEEVPDNGTSLAAVGEFFDVWVYDHTANKEKTDVIPEPEYFKQITEAGSGWEHAGTLKELLSGNAVLDGIMDKDMVRKAGQNADKINADTTDGLATEHTYTIALHMSEDATDEVDKDGKHSLMGKRIMLNVKLVAYQMSSEQDAFSTTYDMEAFAGTMAQVSALENKKIKYQFGTDGNSRVDETLDTAYQFLPNDTLESIKDAPYKYYHADFVVKADQDVPADSIILAGYYKAWCDLLSEKEEIWVALTNENTPIEAGTEIRLVELLGATVNYEEICKYGNDGIGFKCGAVEIDDKLPVGTTLTVELRLYETTENGSSTNVETGRYIVVGTYEYTFE